MLARMKQTGENIFHNKFSNADISSAAKREGKNKMHIFGNQRDVKNRTLNFITFYFAS